MSDMKDKIREAVSKRLKEDKEFIFEGIEFYQEKTLDEFFSENDREDYTWRMSLAESLYDSEDAKELVGNRTVQYKVGDIILTNNYRSKSQGGGYVPDSQHKILVITSKQEDNGIINYSGFLLSSKYEKSNKYTDRYPNNIYINPYNSILYKGTPSRYNEVFIRVDDLVTFTNMDLSTSGSWKGKASWDFLNFVQSCVDNYRTGKDNSKVYWER